MLEGIQKIIKIYRKSGYQFPLTMKCLYCSQILISAYQTNCGCLYCKECLDEYKGKGNIKCLGVDCENIESPQPDNAVNKDIANFKVSCLFKSGGCVFEGLLKNINNHLNDCVFNPDICSQLNKSPIHDSSPSTLPYRLQMSNIKCEFSKKSIPLETPKNTQLNTYKDDLCENFLGFCSNKCGNKNMILLRNYLGISENRLSGLPYLGFTCKHRSNYSNTNRYLTKLNCNFSTSILPTSNKELSTFNEKYNWYLDNQYLMDNMRNLNLEVFKPTENTSKVSVNTMRNRDSNVIHRNGTYIWKIEKFESLKKNAESGQQISITSEPFYTQEFGYKMSMMIYPAGDWMGKGSYFSVFFNLMRGDYDDLLQWPFKKEVTVAILDQKNTKNYFFNTFKPDPTRPCFQKPTEEYNVAMGNSKFIMFNQLSETFLKGDTLFLKIQVQT